MLGISQRLAVNRPDYMLLGMLASSVPDVVDGADRGSVRLLALIAAALAGRNHDVVLLEILVDDILTQLNARGVAGVVVDAPTSRRIRTEGSVIPADELTHVRHGFFLGNPPRTPGHFEMGDGQSSLEMEGVTTEELVDLSKVEVRQRRNRR